MVKLPSSFWKPSLQIQKSMAFSCTNLRLKKEFPMEIGQKTVDEYSQGVFVCWGQLCEFVIGLSA